MSINSLIPLQAGNIQNNVGDDINDLADFIENKKAREKQEARQSKIDESNQELRDIQIQNARSQIAATNKDQSFRDMAVDAVKVKTFLDNNDVVGARNYTLDRINRLNERRKTDGSINTDNTEQFLKALDADPNSAKSMLEAEIAGLTQLGYIKEGKADAGFTLSAGQVRHDAQGNVVASVEPKPDVLSPEAEAQKLRIAAASKSDTNINIGADGEPIPIVTPPELLEGLPEKVAAKVDATFKAAGGGKDGINAIDKVKSEFKEEERRLVSGKLIQESFPNATPAELNQLQATMDSAVSTESGLTKAKSVREEQRRLTKAAGFQDRAITLLEKILSNDQLTDVLGSIEGSIDMRFSDAEAELISDIEEASNILTADNLNLMTGVLSETDIKILANLASGGLNRKRSEGRFKEDAGEILSKLRAKRVETVNDTNETTVGRFKVKAK